MEAAKIKLRTSDDIVVETDKAVMMRSVFIKSFFDNEEIPLPEVSKHILDKIIMYLTYIHAGNAEPETEKPLRSNKLKDLTTEWFAYYIDIDVDTLQDLLNTSSYLDINLLKSICCAQLGSIIRGLTLEEFRKMFNIRNDFTPEEEVIPFTEDDLNAASRLMKKT